MRSAAGSVRFHLCGPGPSGPYTFSLKERVHDPTHQGVEGHRPRRRRRPRAGGLWQQRQRRCHEQRRRRPAPGRRHAEDRHAAPADRLAGLPRPAGVRGRRPGDPGDQRRRRGERQGGREVRRRLRRRLDQHRLADRRPPALGGGRRDRRRRLLRGDPHGHGQGRGRGRRAVLAGQHLDQALDLPRQRPVLPHRPPGHLPGRGARQPGRRRTATPRRPSSPSRTPTARAWPRPSRTPSPRPAAA